MTRKDYLLHINGEWRHARDGSTSPLINPATEQEIGSVARAATSDIGEALDSAAASFKGWRNTSVSVRASILARASVLLGDQLQERALSLTLEQGKTLRESQAEYRRAIATFEWTAAHASSLCEPKAYPNSGFGRFLRPEPVGVVAAFIPWNYPVILGARKLAAALGAGCCVILKGAEEAPSGPVAIVEALTQAGLPPGVVNLLFGHPPTISSQLLSSHRVQMVTFTGSTAVGRQIAEASGRSLKRCVLELGGHAPVVVFADADLEAAARAISDYKFECAGQSCNAPSRLLVEGSVYDEFLEIFTDVAGNIRVGDGANEDVDMGPMANARRVAAMKAFVRDATRCKGRVLMGGAPLDGPGYFWPPTLIENLTDDARLMREEPFGPILPVGRFATFDEAIERANNSQYGLASYVFTRSTTISDAAIEKLETGTVHVNQLKGVPEDAPSGGVKDSGYGYEGGDEGFKSFMNLKLVGRRAR